MLVTHQLWGMQELTCIPSCRPSRCTSWLRPGPELSRLPICVPGTSHPRRGIEVAEDRQAEKQDEAARRSTPITQMNARDVRFVCLALSLPLTVCRPARCAQETNLPRFPIRFPIQVWHREGEGVSERICDRYLK